MIKKHKVLLLLLFFTPMLMQLHATINSQSKSKTIRSNITRLGKKSTGYQYGTVATMGIIVLLLSFQVYEFCSRKVPEWLKGKNTTPLQGKIAINLFSLLPCLLLVILGYEAIKWQRKTFNSNNNNNNNNSNTTNDV